MLCNNIKNMTPLYLALQNGQNIEIVQYLVLQGANIECRTIDNITPLHCASLNGHLNIVQFLCERGANIRTSLHLAVKSNHFEIAKYLIQVKHAPAPLSGNHVPPDH